MLLTLAARSLRTLVSANGEGAMSLLDLPTFAMQELQLRGVNVPSSMLAGWSLEDLDRLRDRGDKAGCPCLVLIEDSPMCLASPDPKEIVSAADRIQRLAVAANRLGCNALAIRCTAADTDEAFDQAALELKRLMPVVERLELNLLIAPHEGLTERTDRLTDLLKRIGGFRIGSLPDFGHAADSGDLVDALRKLAPYAGAVHATIEGFDDQGRHEKFDLAEAVAAIRSVGFLNTLAIDYVGEGDAVANIERARTLLEKAIEADTA